MQRPKKKPVTNFDRFRKLATQYTNISTARFILMWLSPFLIIESFFLDQSIGTSNYLETFPSELIFPTLMNMFTATIIASILLFIKRPSTIGAKLAVSTLLGLLMVNYDSRLNSLANLFRALLPILPKPGTDLAFISLIFIILLFILSIRLGRLLESKQLKYEKLNDTNIVVFVFILVGIMTFGQASRVAHILPILIKESGTQTSQFTKQTSDQTVGDKPDIYYIVLDRYTNSNVLKEQFNYDNSDFTGYLRDNGFTVNDSAYDNYPYTTISISSTMSADYTNKLVAPFKDNETQSRTLYHNLIRQSSVAQALKSTGYKYYTLGSWYGASNKNPLADQDMTWDHTLTVFGKIKRLRDIESVAFQASPYYRLAQTALSWWPLKIQDRTQLDDIKYQLTELNNFGKSKQQGGRFIFAHILSPHGPYLFNADGSLNTNSDTDNVGKNIKDKYVGQISFINTQIKELVANIQKNSNGQAAIILNADEGEYPQFINTAGLTAQPAGQIVEDGVTNGDMSMWPLDWLKMKFGILQAVYIPKATPDDLTNISSVNMFRVVLNRYAGYSLNYLPNCHYALNRGGQYEYDYVDISVKLSGVENPQCKTYQSITNKK